MDRLRSQELNPRTKNPEISSPRISARNSREDLPSDQHKTGEETREAKERRRYGDQSRTQDLGQRQTSSSGSRMLDHPSLEGFPVGTWGGVQSARVLQTSSRDSLPPNATLSSKIAYQQQRKMDGTRFLYGSGDPKPSPFRSSTNMSSGVGKFHLLMANQIFERKLKMMETICPDDYITIEEVHEVPKTVKTKFVIDISEAPSSDKSINQTLKDAEAVLNL